MTPEQQLKIDNKILELQALKKVLDAGPLEPGPRRVLVRETVGDAGVFIKNMIDWLRSI